MFKPFFALLLLAGAVSCNTNELEEPASDTTANQPVDTLTVEDVSLEVLALLQKNDVKALADYTDPSVGVRFSPYAYVDTTSDVVFSRQQLTKLQLTDSFLWGHFDGTGDPIRMNVKSYFKRFVYDADFLNAEKIALNHTFGTGNSIDNVTAVYPDCDYIEYYFSGFNKEYGGMDWRSLKLVFRKEQERFYLVGIVHGEWTI